MEVLLKSFILVVSLAAQTGALELLVIGEGKDMIETRKVTMVLLFIAIQISSFIYLLILFFLMGTGEGDRIETRKVTVLLHLIARHFSFFYLSTFFYIFGSTVSL